MKVSFWQLASGLSGLAIALHTFIGLACDPATEVTSQPPTPDQEPALPIILEPLLPPLSTSDIEALQTDLTFGIDTWFGLAGLDKAPDPPAFTAELQAYQREWSQRDIDITPFLGYWYDMADYAYTLGIFPSQTPGQVCIVEFRPEWSLDLFNPDTGESGKDVIAEQILSFSIATVQDGQLRSSQMRSAAAAIASARYAVGEPYSVYFMSVTDAAGTNRVVAAAAPPMLAPELPATLTPEIAAALSAHGCN